MRILLRTPEEVTESLCADRPIDLHRRLPGYAPTPLIEAPALAKRLGVGRVYVKDETSRFDLPSFKILGASFAACAALAERLGPLPEGRLTYARLRDWASPLRPLTLLAATDGNHGRAVARVARWLGLGARIYIPDFVSSARRAAIEREGAELVVIDGVYDASVDAALDASADPATLLVSDTARTPVDPMPRLVSAGYTTIFAEVDRQLRARGEVRVDTVAIQAGVGGLATACTLWARQGHKANPPRVAVVEPATAACVMTALAAGEPVGVAADEISLMNVLQCGTVSLTAFETLRAGVSCCLAVEDRFASQAADELRRAGVDSGPSGAAGMAGLLGAIAGPMADAVRTHLGLHDGAALLVVATEASSAGATPDVATAGAVMPAPLESVPAE